MSDLSQMSVYLIRMPSSGSFSGIRPAPTSAASASQFQSKVIFDEIERRLKEVPLVLFCSEAMFCCVCDIVMMAHVGRWEGTVGFVDRRYNVAVKLKETGQRLLTAHTLAIYRHTRPLCGSRFSTWPSEGFSSWCQTAKNCNIMAHWLLHVLMFGRPTVAATVIRPAFS